MGAGADAARGESAEAMRCTRLAVCPSSCLSNPADDVKHSHHAQMTIVRRNAEVQRERRAPDVVPSDRDVESTWALFRVTGVRRSTRAFAVEAPSASARATSNSSAVRNPVGCAAKMAIVYAVPAGTSEGMNSCVARSDWTGAAS